MENEKIQVTVTETEQVLDVVVLKKTVDYIEVVVGEGVHSVKCKMTPSGNGQAYVGNVMGREIIYYRTPEQVQADMDKFNPRLRKSRPQ